jgi:hypothetical protein
MFRRIPETGESFSKIHPTLLREAPSINDVSQSKDVHSLKQRTPFQNFTNSF